MLGSDSDSDWDADFGEKGGGGEQPPKRASLKIITGVFAQPGDCTEVWDDDFDFAGESDATKSDEEEKEIKLKTSFSPLSQSKPSTFPQVSKQPTFRRLTVMPTLRRHSSAVDSEARIMALLKNTYMKLTDISSFLSPPIIKKEDVDPIEKKNTLTVLLEKAKAAKDKVEISRLQFELGLLDSSRGFLVEAMQQFQAGLEILEELGKFANNELKVQIRLHMGLTAKAMQDFLRAIEIFNEAINKVDVIKNKDHYARLQYEVGLCYEAVHQRQKWAEAFIQHLSALVTIPRWSPEQCHHVSNSLYGLSQYSRDHFDLPLAEGLLKYAMEVAKEHNVDLYKRIEAGVPQKEDSNLESSDWDAGLPTLVSSTPKVMKTGIDAHSETNSPEELKIKEKVKSKKKEDQSDEGSDWDKEFANSAADESDWERDFNIQTPSKFGNFGGVVNLFPNQASGITVQQYALLPEKNFKTVLYPRPSVLYSLKTEDNHKLMNETKLESWLSNLITKHKDVLQMYGSDAKKVLNTTLKEAPVGSDKWITAHLAYWRKLDSNVEPLWDSIMSFFDNLHQFLKKDKKNSKERHVDLVMDALHIASIITKDAQGFHKIVQTCIDYEPKNVKFVKLIEVATNAHLQRRKNISTNHTAVTDFCTIYLDAKKNEGPPLTQSDLLTLTQYDPRGIQAAALAQLHLFFIERSPLTTRPLKIDPEFYESSTEDVNVDKLLLQDEHRIKLMFELYPYLKLSYLKAKVAYTLALYEMERGEMELVEQLLFETVFILDTYQKDSTAFPALISDLGGSVLSSFGEVLHSNYKYKYAILTFEAALSVFSVSDDDEYSNLLHTVAKCAHEENDLKRAIDMYSEILMRYKKSEKNRVNEIIYVSEILSSMYMELGDFLSAEKYLLVALKPFLPQEASEQNAIATRAIAAKRKPLDPTYFSLKVMLATVYLCSYCYFERGLRTLENLMCLNPQAEIQKVITEKLIVVCMEE